MKITLTDAVRIAKRSTERVANMKDYQVRNKALRAGREEARKLHAGKGYIVKDGRVYGFMYNSIWKIIELVAIR